MLTVTSSGIHTTEAGALTQVGEGMAAGPVQQAEALLDGGTPQGQQITHAPQL